MAMPENLSAIEKKALESGAWQIIEDPKGGPFVYYNPITNKTTRDLKGELIMSMESPKSKAEAKPGAGASGATEYHMARIAELQRTTEAPSEVEKLREELRISRVLNEQYEHELTQIRHSLLSGHNRGSDLDKPICNTALAFIRAEGGNSDDAANKRAQVLAERVRTVENLNSRLYKQLLLDRETRFVCDSCRDRSVVEEMRGDLNERRLELRTAQVTIAENLKPHTLRIEEAAELLTRKATDEELQQGQVPNYLPKSFMSGSVATAMAPLNVGTSTSVIPAATQISSQKKGLNVGRSSINQDVPLARLRFDMTPPLTITNPSIFSSSAGKGGLHGGNTTTSMPTAGEMLLSSHHAPNSPAAERAHHIGGSLGQSSVLNSMSSVKKKPTSTTASSNTLQYNSSPHHHQSYGGGNIMSSGAQDPSYLQQRYLNEHSGAGNSLVLSSSSPARRIQF